MSSRSPRIHVDFRFIIGVVLVIAAVAGVWGVISAARTTTGVWVAARTLVPGEQIQQGDLREAEVGLGEGTAAYLPSATSAEGSIVTRVVEEGELVPRAAVGTTADAEATNVVIATEGSLAAAVAPGRSVELWSTDASAEDARPHLLVADATVVSTHAEGSGMMSGGTSVELLIPRTAISDVLQAQAAGAVLAVVPVTGAS